MPVDFAHVTNLTPNALAIIAAIGALDFIDHTSSPKTYQVGAALGQNEAWVRRHGKAVNTTTHVRNGSPRLADLSANGHCSLESDGKELARLLRCTPATEPPARCGACGAPPVGKVHAGRQLFACGLVRQFCPDHVPGYPRAEVSPRSMKAQHTGMWFVASRCGGNYQGGRWPSWARWERDVRTSLSVDNVELVPGAIVSASRGSNNAFARYGNVRGEVLEAANGTALVSWPAVGDHPAVEAEIMAVTSLITPGAPDPSCLSDYQADLWRAIQAKEVILELNAEQGTYGGRFNDRVINPRALEVLIECRLLLPPAYYLDQAA